MPIQTTMIVATKKKVSGFDSHDWPCAGRAAQLTMPYWVSKIHCQITVAVSAGIAQASISPIIVSSRIFGPSRFSSSAISMPSTIVSATLTTQKTTVRRSTSQNSASVRIVAEVVETDPIGGGAELLLQPELLQRQRHQANERVAEHQRRARAIAGTQQDA